MVDDLACVDDEIKGQEKYNKGEVQQTLKHSENSSKVE